MKKALFILLLLPCIFQVSSAQESTLRGFVFSSKDSMPLERVHIINLDQNKGTISGKEGRFSIPAEAGDSLWFSALGYHHFTVSADSLSLKDSRAFFVFLKNRVYPLDSITIYPYPTFAKFRHAFVHMEIEENMTPDLSLPPVSHPVSGSGQPCFVFRGAITAFANLFSRRHKEKIKLDRLIKREAYQAELRKKYNPEIVKKLTGMSHKEVKDFMAYCALRESFVEEASQYEILEVIQNCLASYNREREAADF